MSEDEGELLDRVEKRTSEEREKKGKGLTENPAK